MASTARLGERGANYTMPLNIKDNETERLAKEVAELTGESKTGAIRTALRERGERLALQQSVADRRRVLRAFLEEEVWPVLPTDRRRTSSEPRGAGRDSGYGPDGV
jgi:antitoxin VapB